MISSPCRALCCPISSVSHFYWSQFIRQPPIIKRCFILQDGRSEAADALVSTSAAPTNLRILYEIYTSNTTHASHHTPSANFRAFPEQLMETKMRLYTVFRRCSTTPPPGGRQGRCRRPAEAFLAVSCLSSALIKLT